MSFSSQKATFSKITLVFFQQTHKSVDNVCWLPTAVLSVSTAVEWILFMGCWALSGGLFQTMCCGFKGGRRSRCYRL